MISVRLPGLLAVLLAVPGVGHAAPPKAPGVGDKAPDLGGVLRANGRNAPWSWKSHRGQIVVLSFNASWCTPCKKELPIMAELMKKWAKYRRPHVGFFTINLDDELDVGRTFIESLGLGGADFSLYDPKGRVAGRYRPKVMPTTYIIDRRGLIHSIHHGYQDGDAAVLERAIRAALRDRR